MSIMFVTCDKERALGFINKMYPENEDLVLDEIPLLIDLIEKDILRVQDPEFHNPCQIVAGKNYSEDYNEDIQDAINELKDKLG